MDTIIEILVDASGSMGFMKGIKNHENIYLIDGQTRMSIIKKILKDEILPVINYASKITVRTFRCNSKNVDGKTIEEPFIVSIYSGIYNENAIAKICDNLQDPPPGGTPIAAAIDASVTELAMHPNSDRKIILLTDGEENGGGNYQGAAKKALELHGIPCKIFIIGLNQDITAEAKSKEIASGGYLNIKTKTYSPEAIRSTLTQIKIQVIENSIHNKELSTNTRITSTPIQKSDPPLLQTAEEENKLVQNKYFDALENKLRQHISNNQQLLLEVISLRNHLRINELKASAIDTTTLTIDDEYSESLRKRSEDFLFKYLVSVHGPSKINWLNENGESYKDHDFELLDDNGTVIQFIECKGTPKTKPTFYLTANEWSHFLKNKEMYYLYRVFNIEAEPTVVNVGNLLNALLNQSIVPYLLKPEVLKEERVFLTLNVDFK